jgi:hypothetical protein
MKYSSRFFLYAPLALFLALAAGVGVNWWIDAGALARRLDALNGRPALPGVTLYFSSKRIGGFPFNLDVVFRDFRVEVATGHGPSTWTSEKFALHALTYGREQIIVEAAGRQLVTWTDLDGVHHARPFEVGEWHASAITDVRGVRRFDMDLIGLGSAVLTAARLQMHARLDPAGNALDIAAVADAVRPSPALSSLFGETIAQIRLNASATPARSFDAIRAARASWQDALEAWRTAGGSLRIATLELRWERLGAMGVGTLSLDETHTVQGLLDFKVAGIATLLDSAARHHVRGASNQGIAAALLERAAKGGSNEAGLLGAVLGFHDGMVSVGDVPATTEEPLY